MHSQLTVDSRRPSGGGGLPGGGWGAWFGGNGGGEGGGGEGGGEGGGGEGGGGEGGGDGSPANWKNLATAEQALEPSLLFMAMPTRSAA